MLSGNRNHLGPNIIVSSHRRPSTTFLICESPACSRWRNHVASPQVARNRFLGHDSAAFYAAPSWPESFQTLRPHKEDSWITPYTHGGFRHMWLATTLRAGGSRRTKEHTELSGSSATAESIVAACRELAVENAVLRALVETIAADFSAAESLPVNPACGLLDQWGDFAVSALSDVEPPLARERQLPLSRYEMGSRGELLTLDETGTVVGAVWSDATYLVTSVDPNDDRVEIDYLPDAQEHSRALAVEQSASRRSACYIDWRLYIGTGSAVLAGHGPSGGYSASARTFLGGVTGWLIGRVTRVIGYRQRSFASDPSFRPRLAWYEGEASYAKAAASCLKLGGPGFRGRECAIIVHGTTSCSLPIASSISTLTARRTLLRFEHDTFLSIADNAMELHDLVIQTTATDVLFVCHSRGGLVARRAAQLLHQARWPGQLAVETFGTPHLGTPLASLRSRVLGLIFLAGAVKHGGAGFTDPATATFQMLLRTAETPEGIGDMRPEGTPLRLLNQNPEPYAISSWGGVFNQDRPNGFGPALRGRWGNGAFRGEPNDLVVPFDSATGRGVRQPGLQCTHYEYFTQTAVQASLRRVL